MSMPPDAPRRLARRLFLGVLGFSAFHCFFLIADRRVPLGHDTGRLFSLQHAFANGDVPQPAGGRAWIEQGTLLQNALLTVAPAFPSVPFVPLFHLGMFLEELILLVGVWLLASRYYRSPHSRLVVAVGALGSCLWIDNAAVNLLAFSSLPLLLHFLHEGLETKERRPLLMAGLLAVLQIMGRPPEFALLVPTAALIYATGAALLFGYPLRERLGGLSWTKRDTAGAILLLATALAVAGSALAGVRDEVPAPPSGPGILGAVLAGAGFQNPLGFIDAVLGFSPGLDATAFCGSFTLALAVLGTGSLGSRKAWRLLGFVLAALAALALFPILLGVLLSIPSRATPQGLPLLRLVVIFLAGFGCEKMLELRGLPTRLLDLPAKGLLLASGAMAVLFVFNPFDERLIRHATRALTLGIPAPSVSPLLDQADLFRYLAGAAALMMGLAGGTLLLRSSGWRRAPLALALILLLHPLDVFGWKFRMTWMKSCSLSPARASAQSLVGMPALPFPGGELLRPPLPAYLESPYGAGSTPLRSEPPAGSLHRPVGATGGRSPLRFAFRGILGIFSIVVIGWTLRRTARLAGTGST